MDNGSELEGKMKEFLVNAPIDKLNFSKAFDEQIQEIRNLSLSKGYVIKRSEPNVGHERSALGRTYSEFYSNNNISTLTVPSHP